MTDAFPNSIKEGVPWSADLEPDGPDYDADDNYNYNYDRVSQSDSSGLYDGLPDISVPKRKVA